MAIRKLGTLPERLEKSGLPERQQLILALAPGCLFGFPPDNLDHIMAMVDCTTCRAIMGVVKLCTDIAADLQYKIDEFLQPARQRNQARQRAHADKRRRFVIGRFTRPLKLEPEPDYRSEPWFVRGKQDLEEPAGLLPQLAAQCAAHWGVEERREESRKVVACFAKKDRAQCYTLNLEDLAAGL